MVLCRRLDLFGRELIAVDGTRLKAVNGRDRNVTRAKLDRLIASADECLNDYLMRLDRADRSDKVEDRDRAAVLSAKLASLRKRRDRHAALLGELAASGETQISFTDPDSRAMAAHPASATMRRSRSMPSTS